MAQKVKEYMGILIFPADLNSSGIRYYSRVNGKILRADNLVNQKWMIRDYLRAVKLGLEKP